MFLVVGVVPVQALRPRSVVLSRRGHPERLCVDELLFVEFLLATHFLCFLSIFLNLEFRCQVFFLGPAALPAFTPVADEEVEAERVDLHAGLEADAEVAIVHFILVDVGVQQAQVTGDGEEEIVVEWWELREFVLEHLRDFGGALAFICDALLGFQREYLVWEFAKPCLEHGANGIDVIEIGFLEEVDIQLCKFVNISNTHTKQILEPTYQCQNVSANA